MTPTNVRCLLRSNGERTPYAVGQMGESEWRVLFILSPLGAYVTMREVYPGEGAALQAASSLCKQFKEHFSPAWAQAFKEMHKGTFVEVAHVR